MSRWLSLPQYGWLLSDLTRYVACSGAKSPRLLGLRIGFVQRAVERIREECRQYGKLPVSVTGMSRYLTYLVNAGHDEGA
jgi:hypothetical protein